jgi:hypothetical protein
MSTEILISLTLKKRKNAICLQVAARLRRILIGRAKSIQIKTRMIPQRPPLSKM